MNKTLDLCALGNGLVDLQYEIKSEKLAKLNIGKSEMRLVDSDTQKELLDKFADKESIICSGGSAANSIIVFSALGGKAGYMTSLGADEFGYFYAKEFEQLGIRLNAVHLPKEATGTCLVLITEDSERSMLTCLAASSKYDKSQLDEQVIADSKWLYVEGFKFSEPSSTEAIFKAIEVAKKNDTKIALTFSDKFIIDFYKDNLKKVAESAELLFCNEAEAKAFTGTEDINDALESMKSIVPNFVITMGAKGSMLHWDGELHHIKSFPVNAIDTTGAGDTYAGAFLYGIISGQTWYKSAELASYLSSRIVAQFGARFKEDINQWKNEILQINK